MKLRYKIYCLIYIVIVGVIVFNSNVTTLTTDLEYVRCGQATGIPKPVPQLTSIAYTILIVGVPLVLIAFGILTLVKALASSNSDNVAKAKSKLGKKFVIAAAALLTASIVQFVINRVSNDGDGDSVAECISCFLYGTNCGVSTTGNDVKTDTIYSNYSNGAIQTSNKVSNSNTSTSNTSNSSNVTLPTASKTILVGDSRTVGICGFSNGNADNAGNCRNVLGVARVSMGLSWFKSTAIGKVDTLLSQSTNEKYNIVILLGVNDVYQPVNYFNTINSEANGRWKNHNVIFASIGPIGADTAGNVKKSDIETFNNTIKNKIGSSGTSNLKYCDIYSKLTSGLAGKYASDKLHYTTAGYTEYYNIVMNSCI